MTNPNWINKLQTVKYDGKTKNAVQIYEYLITNFSPENIKQKKYQSLYSQFFKLSRRNQKWRELYFDFLYDLATKYYGKQINVSFLETCIDNFYEIQKMNGLVPKVETSFISKALHMINNNLPIWDSNIKVSLLGLNKNYDPIKKDPKKAKQIYEKINSLVQEKIIQDKDKIDTFRQCFPNESKNLTDVKIIDFYYWSSISK